MAFKAPKAWPCLSLSGQMIRYWGYSCTMYMIRRGGNGCNRKHYIRWKSDQLIQEIMYWTVQATLSRKSHWGQKKLLHMGPWNSKSLGDFLQHMQKSEFFNQVFWRNRDLKFFPYKTSCDKKARFTKWSVWRSSWSKKSH